MSTDFPHQSTPSLPISHDQLGIDQPRPDRPGIWRIDAAAAFDATHEPVTPASLLIRVGPIDRQCDSIPFASIEILAIGPPGEIDDHPESGLAQRLSLPRAAILPGLVNAHTHLDLTDLGPMPHDPADGFVAWVDRIRAARPTTDDAIERAVGRGIELLLASGTVAVGDIAGAPNGVHSLTPWRVLRDGPMRGVSYLETFGIGPHEEAVRERLARVLDEAANERDSNQRVALGLSPHAPNTVSRAMYRWVCAQGEALGLPICTHLAESIEERQFITDGSGPQRDLLERFGMWDDSLFDDIGAGLHPVEHLEPILAGASPDPILAVHVNDATDRAIEILAATGSAVVYCPRASAYFGAPTHFGPHRYRAMIEAGIPVAVGTDSIVNLPPGTEQTGISVLDELRLLYQRDGTDPVELLAMATTVGARVLGLDPGDFELAAGSRPAGLVAVPMTIARGRLPTLGELLLGSGHPRLLLGGT